MPGSTGTKENPSDSSRPVNVPRREVTPRWVPPLLASASEAMDMVHAGLGWLAAADATALGDDEQARCLRRLEQATSMVTAARASDPGGVHLR